MSGEQGNESSMLESLPGSLLLNLILSSLNASTLGRLACCSRHLRLMATMDQLWLPHCIAFDFIPMLSRQGSQNLDISGDLALPALQTSWHKNFCYNQNRRCTECGEPTQYVFTLLPSRKRLCERCEHAFPKYALITELEAKERYQLEDVDLSSLPFKEVSHKRFSVRFFLKTTIEQVVDSKEAVKEDDSLDVGQGGGSETDSCTSSTDNEGASEIKKSPVFKIQSKEARKEHKRQVKNAKREQRMLRDQLGKNGRRLSLEMPEGSTGISQKNSIMDDKVKKDVAINADASTSTEVSKKTSKRAKWRAKSDHYIADSGQKQGGSSSACKWKSKSPSKWVRERDWIEVELGAYGISALEVVSDE